MNDNLTYNYPWDYDYDGDSGTGMINPPPFPGGGGVDENEMNAAIKTAVDKLVGGAPEALDTLGELADALEGDESIVSAVMNQLVNKVDKNTYEADKETFALKSEIPTIPENLSAFNNDTGFITESALDGYAKSDNVYTKSETDELLTNKLDKNTYESEKDGFALKEEVYTKSETDELLEEKLDKTTYEAERENFALVENIPTKVSELTNDSEFINAETVNGIVDSKTEDMATKTWVEEQNYLTEHQSLEEYATKEEMNSSDDGVLTNILERIWSNTNKEKTGYFQTKYTNADGSYAMIWNESDGGGSLYENKTDGIKTYVGVNADGRNGICAQIYSKDVTTNTGSRLNINPNGMFYGVGNSASIEAGKELAVKDDIATDRAEVDAIIAEKDATIAKLTSDLYDLKKAVGNIGGAVTYELPGPEGKTFNTLMGNTGTVKLTDNVESGRYGPGIMASNKTTLNLNNHDLTITGLTESTAQAGIMARGTQEITITGKGTIDSGAGICVEANGADCVINLIGNTTVYHNNRPGGELIYCYNGTINITNGTFRNDGASNYTLNCYDANYTAGTAKIIVSSTSKTTGPKFYDFNPGDNLSEGEHTNYVAEGCHVISNTVIEDEIEHTIYTVVKDT